MLCVVCARARARPRVRASARVCVRVHVRVWNDGEIDELRKELNDIKDENRTIRASKQDLAQQVVEYTSERPEPTTTERNIKLIGDSNMIILHGYLEMDLVIQIPLTKTFTLEDAIEWAETMGTQDKDSIHLIVVGTNNIKRGETAQQCANKHLRMTNILDRNNIQYIILQIPPSYRIIGRDTNFCNRETIKFNYKLAEKHDTISMEPLGTDRSMIAHGGIHLTDNACIILGPEIIEKCRNINKYPERQATKTETSVTVTVNNDPAEHQDPTPRTTQPTDTVSEIFNTDKIRAGRIIGKKGTNILKNSTQVEIARIETNLETSFIIKGQENAVKQAKQLMEKIAKETKDNNRHIHQEKRNTICRYHKMGRCLRDDRCMYLHQEGPLDVSTSPTDYEYTRDEWTPERHPNTWTSGNQQPNSRQHSPDRRHRERTPLGYRDRTPNTRPHTPEHRLMDKGPSRAGGSSQNVLQLKPQIGTSSWDPCTWEWSGMTMKHQGTWRWCDLLAKDEHFNVIITWNYMNIDFTEVPLNRCPLTCDWSVGSLSTNPGYGHYKICPEVNRASWFRNDRNGWQHI